MNQDRFRDYLKRERKSRRFRRAADFVFLVIVLMVLAGSALGLKPEFEESKRLDGGVRKEQARVEKMRLLVEEHREHLRLLMNDPEFMEQRLRNRASRQAKPDEVLLIVPAERREIYERAEP